MGIDFRPPFWARDVLNHFLCVTASAHPAAPAGRAWRWGRGGEGGARGRPSRDEQMVRRASPAGAAARNGAQIKNDAISAPPGPNGCDRRRLRNVPPAEPRGGRAVGRTPLPANGTAAATSPARPPIGKARFSPGGGGAGPPFSPGRAGRRALIRCDSLARCPRRSSSAKCSQSAPIIYLWGLSVSSWLTRRVRGVARGAFSPSRAG